ncbi:MAG TPA: UvrD-helicase domain-containing protein [Candidatus Paceibacterota bacterium]
MKHTESLNKAQKEAVLHTEGALLIVAGAGAGKTKTLTHRIANLVALGVKPTSILAVTFTNKAAGEMRERVFTLLSSAGGQQNMGVPLVTTFHSLCVRILREFALEANIPKRFVIWDRDDSVRAMKAILKGMDLEWNPSGVLEMLSRQRGNGVKKSVFAEQSHSHKEKTLLHVWELYDKALSNGGALDFDDLLIRALSLLKDNTTVRQLLQSRWNYIHVDEYQDTNRVQYELVRLLGEKHGNVCAVGDVDQCIYTWRNATIENLLSFERVFPNTKTVLLEQNYRSTRTILTAANGVIEKNKNRVPKNLYTENGTGDPIGLFAGHNEDDEAAFVASKTLLEIQKGVAPSHIAVLYRNNFQSRALEEAFLSRTIPYKVLGVRFFERREVKDLLSYIRAALNQKSRGDIERIIGVPTRGIGKQTLAKMFAGEEMSGASGEKVRAFLALLERIRFACETLPASEAMRYTLEESGLLGFYSKESGTHTREEARERLLNIHELLNLSARHDSENPPEGLDRVLEEAALASEQDELKEGANAVSLMTVHASKGLEFETVFVTGLEQGLFPYVRGTETEKDRDPEEERRLLYVALTRAKKKLFLSYADSRARYGTRESTTPSEFLLDIDPRLVEHATYESEESTIN